MYIMKLDYHSTQKSAFSSRFSNPTLQKVFFEQQVKKAWKNSLLGIGLEEFEEEIFILPKTQDELLIMNISSKNPLLITQLKLHQTDIEEQLLLSLNQNKVIFETITLKLRNN
jgi:hypothetical protein